ncbi:MAG: tetratricopeptide repeat protein, partial [Proteobacteria bacterium]|nr:tetratricopeptide repeat protein [Pseudomonadota bacterium]
MLQKKPFDMSSKWNLKYWAFLYFPCIIVFIIIFLYFPVIQAPFLFDDSSSIVDNPAIHSLDLKKIYAFKPLRFIGYLSFALNFYFSKVNTLSYHLVNISVHILYILFSFLFIKTLWQTPSGKAVNLSTNEKTLLALATVFILAVHPLSTFAVSYIVQRLAALTALFYVGTLFFYLKARLSQNIPGKISWSLFFILFLTCSLFTKQNSFTIFPQLFFLELFCFNLTPRKRLALILFLPVLVLSFYISIRYNFIDLDEIRTLTMETTQISRIEYLSTQFSVLCFYLKLFFYPINLALDYQFPVLKSITNPGVFIPALILTAILLIALWVATKKKFRLIAYGIFFYFTAISIESSIIPIRDAIFLHRTYLPNLGLAFTSILLTYIILKKMNFNRYGLISIFFICAVILSGFTFKTNLIFQTPGKVWARVLEVSPGHLRGYVNISRDHLDNKLYDKAIAVCTKAISINLGSARIYNNRGVAYKHTQKFDKALLDYKKAIELDPKYADVYNNCGAVYYIQNEFDKAILNYNKAIVIDPTNAVYYNNRGAVYKLEKKYNQAISDYTQAIHLNPLFDEAFHNRGLL